MGLPKHHRLRHRHDFSRAYQKGYRFKTAHLTLRVLRQNCTVVAVNSQSVDGNSASPGETKKRHLPTRIGISISLKVDKRSVIRNRIRRQIQAAFRQLLPRISSNWDLLVVVHPLATECDYFQFLQELEQLLIDAEVIDGNSGGCVL